MSEQQQRMSDQRHTRESARAAFIRCPFATLDEAQQWLQYPLNVKAKSGVSPMQMLLMGEWDLFVSATNQFRMHCLLEGR